MSTTAQYYAVECVRRIHHLWFDEHAEEAPLEKIDILFATLVDLAPYNCCYHVHGLWTAYRSVRGTRLAHLSLYRLKLVTAGIEHLGGLIGLKQESA